MHRHEAAATTQRAILPSGARSALDRTEHTVRSINSFCGGDIMEDSHVQQVDEGDHSRHVRRRRAYDLLITEFGGARATVRVEAKTRQDAFARAVTDHADPDNVHEIELVSDDGRSIDPMRVCGGVPYAEATCTPVVVQEEDKHRVRPYQITLVVFGPDGGEGYERVWARNRAEAFWKVVFDEWNSNNVRSVTLTAVGRTNRNQGDFLWVDASTPYGGVTCDLRGEGLYRDAVILTPEGYEVAINPCPPSEVAEGSEK